MNNLDYVRANIKFDNTYFRELSGFYSPVDPIHVPDPKLICFNNILGDKFDLSSKYFDSPEGAQLFSGNIKPCLLYTSPSPRDATLSRMPSSA